MDKCEKRAYVKEGDKVVIKWEKVSPSGLTDEKEPDLRCILCHGRVRLHKNRQVEGGPKDHFEHLPGKDSRGCPNGINFDGDARRSENPVE